MSVTLYITPERPIAGTDTNGRDRVFMCMAVRSLTAAAKATGVPPLSTYYSYDRPEVSGLIGTLTRAVMPATRWFDAAEVGRTVDALHRHVSGGGPITLRGKDRTAAVLADLDNCRDVLAPAAAAGVRVRLHPGE